MSRTPAVHHLERRVRELEAIYLDEIITGYEEVLAGREETIQTASQNPSLDEPQPHAADPVVPARPAKTSDCHKGLRAVRYAASMADFDAHPELFRCPDCGMLLDPPEYQPAVAARPARKDSNGQRKGKVTR